jgi:hypothetical protein
MTGIRSAQVEEGKERGMPPWAAQGRRIKYLAPKTGRGGPAAGVLAPIPGTLELSDAGDSGT